MRLTPRNSWSDDIILLLRQLSRFKVIQPKTLTIIAMYGFLPINFCLEYHIACALYFINYYTLNICIEFSKWIFRTPSVKLIPELSYFKVLTSLGCMLEHIYHISMFQVLCVYESTQLHMPSTRMSHKNCPTMTRDCIYFIWGEPPEVRYIFCLWLWWPSSRGLYIYIIHLGLSR